MAQNKKSKILINIQIQNRTTHNNKNYNPSNPTSFNRHFKGLSTTINLKNQIKEYGRQKAQSEEN